MDRIILYGTGSGAVKFIKSILERNLYNNLEIICFADSSPEKCNTIFNDKKVVSPEAIKHMDYDYIIVASVHYNEIKIFLEDRFSIASDKIISKEKYLGDKSAKKLYVDRYGAADNGIITDKLRDGERIVVYTANIGGYDVVQDPLVKNEKIDYVLFTDNKNYKSDVWDVRYIDNKFLSSIQCARYHKIFSYKLFPKYRFSVWVDSKYVIIGNLYDYINKYFRNTSMLCFPHPVRDNIFDEAKECVKYGRVDAGEISRQLEQYKKEGLPQRHGLIDSGCLVRFHQDDRLMKLMEDWWKELSTYTMRDQISFPYVVWKNNFDYDICDMYIEQCDYLQIHTCHGN